MIIEVLSPLPWSGNTEQEYISNKLLYNIKSETNLLREWLESADLKEFYEIFEDTSKGNRNYDLYLNIIDKLALN